MTKNGRSYSLDFLKFIATNIIVLHHFQQVTNVKYSNTINFWNGKFYYGYVVELFFILSGYFMVKYIEKIYNEEITLWEWVLSRAKRLLPMVALSAVAYEFIIITYNKLYGEAWCGISVSVWGTIITALGIQEGWGFANPYVNYPVWYISVLLICYIIFYLLTSLSKKLKCLPIYFYIAMIFLGIGISTYNISLPFMNPQVARGYYSFFGGGVLGYFINKYGIPRKLATLSSFVLAGMIIFFVKSQQILNEPIVYLLTYVVYPAIIILLECNIIKKFFKNKIWGIIGNITYDVYLWHNPLLPLMYIILKIFGQDLDFSNIMKMYIFLIVSWIVAILSYYFIEKPIQKKLIRKITV